MKDIKRLGFTLVELLIVIGILGVIASVLVIVLNPAETLRETRDTDRVSSLNSLNRAILFYETNIAIAGGTPDLGQEETVYLSLPDTESDCSTYDTLPDLDPGWSYACVEEATLFAIDGTGWIPIDFTQTTSSISFLPIDPINTLAGGLYYTYVQGSWEISAVLESQKYQERYEGEVLQVGLENNITPSVVLARGEGEEEGGGDPEPEYFSEGFELYAAGTEEPSEWTVHKTWANGSPSVDVNQVHDDKAKSGSNAYKIDSSMVRSCSNGSTSNKAVQITEIQKEEYIRFSAWGENLHGPGGESYTSGRIGLIVVFNLDDESYVSILYKTHETSGKTGTINFYKDGAWRVVNFRYDLGFTQGVWVDVDRSLKDDFNNNFPEHDFDTNVVDLDIAIGGGSVTSQCSNSHGFRGWFDDIEIMPE
jgi:prepilin-type N-terminal cleavage/methylation domain-containing protein